MGRANFLTGYVERVVDSARASHHDAPPERVGAFRRARSGTEVPRSDVGAGRGGAGWEIDTLRAGPAIAVGNRARAIAGRFTVDTTPEPCGLNNWERAAVYVQRAVMGDAHRAAGAGSGGEALGLLITDTDVGVNAKEPERLVPWCAWAGAGTWNCNCGAARAAAGMSFCCAKRSASSAGGGCA